MKISKVLFIWLVMGIVYFAIEGIWRIPQGGYANVVMLFIGGLCGVLVGGINQIPKFYKMKMVWQSLIGTVIVLAVEFCTGVVLNIWLGLGIWDYSDVPFNIMGQICLLYGFLWLLLMPFAIWVEDWLRYKFWSEKMDYTLKDAYKDTFTGR